MKFSPSVPFDAGAKLVGNSVKNPSAEAARYGHAQGAETACRAAADNQCPVSDNVRGHENIEWSIGYSFHLTDENKDLPRALLVGDSICNGYQAKVRARLEGKVNVSYWVSSLCVTSPGYLRMFGYYLDEAKYDVIHFNNGLHSLNTPDEAYAKGVRAALEAIRAKQPQARIVWCSSTPLKSAGRTAKARALNAIGAAEAARLGLATDDLFALLDPLDREKFWVDVFHHNPEARDMEARQVADCVLAAIG